jgi:hypothetical protein
VLCQQSKRTTATHKTVEIINYKTLYSIFDAHLILSSTYSTPPSPIKNVAPQSRVFPRPRLDRARVVSFQSDQSCDLSSKVDTVIRQTLDVDSN